MSCQGEEGRYQREPLHRENGREMVDVRGREEREKSLNYTTQLPVATRKRAQL